jgi:hypothetical protein
MKTTYFAAAFALLGSAAFAGTDANANYGCGWVPAENGNWLTIKEHCAGIPAITGGYTTDTETVSIGCETADVRTTREDRGGRVESVEVSFRE